MADRKSVLLGGPIQHAIDRDGVFDGRFKNLILCLVEILEEAGYRVFSAHLVEDFGDLTPAENSADIVTRDHGWMQRCDVYVAVFPRNGGEFIRSDGTHVEIGWASALGKPIVLVGDGIPSKENSHLVRGLGAITRVQFVPIKDVEGDPRSLLTAIQNAVGGM